MFIYFIVAFSHLLSLSVVGNNYKYQEECFHLADKLKVDTGILVTAYNRPEYFAQVVRSLELNKEAQTLPFVFVLDGGSNAKQKENLAIINSSSIVHKYIILLDENFGCARAIIGARRYMFDWCNFNKIIVFEDDLLVSSQYISLTLSLYEYAKREYSNVGIVQCYNKCFLFNEHQQKYKDLIMEPFGDLRGYCIDRETYNAIKNMMDEHEKLHYIDISPNQSNGEAIARWLEKNFLNHFEKKSNENKNEDKKFFKATVDWKAFCQHFIARLKKAQNLRRDGQDYELRFALQKIGKVRLATVVSRAKYIGSKGAHHTYYSHCQLGYDQSKIFETMNDEQITSFQYKKINVKCICIDLSNFKNSIENAKEKKLDAKIRKFANSLFENGYDVAFLTSSRTVPGLFTNYKYIDYEQRYIKNNNKKEHIRIIPISRISEVEKLKLIDQKIDNIYLYILSEEISEKENMYIKDIINKGGILIVPNEKIKKLLACIYGDEHVMMWYKAVETLCL